MSGCMKDRGPGGAGLWAHGPVALGHRRLKIIDLSERGLQPMIDPELGLSIVFNGCIYNYPELREELSGHGYRFFSTSDTRPAPPRRSPAGPREPHDDLGEDIRGVLIPRDRASRGNSPPPAEALRNQECEVGASSRQLPL
jgi:hypothetical protein